MRAASGHLAIIAALLATPTIAAPVSFVVDDGTSDNAIGNFSEQVGDFLAVNRFDAGAEGAIINEIRFVYGTPAGASEPVIPVSVVLFDDLDEDGLFGATQLLFRSTAAVPSQAQNDVFNSVGVPDIFVSGIFFAGVFAEDTMGTGIIGQDTNDPPGITSIFAGSDLDLTDLPGSADIFAFEPEFTGIALIRAFGTTPVPAPGVLGLFTLGLGLVAYRCRKPGGERIMPAVRRASRMPAALRETSAPTTDQAKARAYTVYSGERRKVSHSGGPRPA